jgi:hypothetical protein
MRTLTDKQETALYHIYNTKDAVGVNFCVSRRLMRMGLVHLVQVSATPLKYAHRVTEEGARLLHEITLAS